MAVRDNRMHPNQAGFGSGQGCIDQIFTLIREHPNIPSNQQPTVAYFIEFVAAFDSIKRSAL